MNRKRIQREKTSKTKNICFYCVGHTFQMDGQAITSIEIEKMVLTMS